MRANPTTLAVVLALAIGVACAEEAPQELIVGTWVIDEAAQRDEIARVSPDEIEDFDEQFPRTLGVIRESFHPDGRYEITNSLGGPFDDRWELVSKSGDRVTIRTSGHSWVSRQALLGAKEREPSPSVLTYEFMDPDHMAVTTTASIFGEERTFSYFFVRIEGEQPRAVPAAPAPTAQ